MNKNVINKIDELINEIKCSNIYKEYIDILDKVNNSELIINLVSDIKDINKKLVKTPSIDLENNLKNKENELNNIPLYLDYKDKLEELNNLLLVVKNRMDSYINEIIIK